MWLVSLDLPQAALRDLERLLSADERGRAGRYPFGRDRRRFVAARGLLRLILGGYLDRPPESLRFEYGPYGKPRVADSPSRLPLTFNVSRSADWALCAVALGREIGVDIECIDPETSVLEIAEHFFARGEIATLKALPRRSRVKAFFDCWTRKEAYIKARGEGLAIPLADFEVSLAPGEPPALLHATDPAELSRWNFRELSVPPGYAAALAVEGRGWIVSESLYTYRPAPAAA